jgi:hypothetical protein
MAPLMKFEQWSALVIAQCCGAQMAAISLPRSEIRLLNLLPKTQISISGAYFSAVEFEVTVRRIHLAHIAQRMNFL